MSHEDFDTDSLASHLHLTPQQVTRMADRGRLPGRKIGGQWRFSQAEIHHWFEEQIGASDEEGLVQVEGVLERAENQSSEISLLDLIPPVSVAIPLLARTRNSVIDEMVELAAKSGHLWDPVKMAEAVRLRETLHPTSLDNGVALLHPRRPMSTILAEPLLALGCTHQGIPFGGGGLTDIFFLICSTDDRVHLRVLARLSRIIGDAAVVSELRAAESAEVALGLIGAAEGRLS